MMRVAIVHDWLTGMRGGEHVLEAILDMFPDAELFTLVHAKGSVSEKISARKIHTSLLQKIPGASEKYRHFLPFMPALVSTFRLNRFDLVISSTHCVAKGIQKSDSAYHVSYVHAPMRYMWDRFDDYFGTERASIPVRLAAHACRPFMQNWDRKVSTEDRVDLFLANSRFISEQIQKIYGRKSKVVHPFTNPERFSLKRQPGDHYLIVGAFAPYKRADIAIEAFNRLKLPLHIVGSGQDERRLRKMAGPGVRFIRPVSNIGLAEHYSKCKALIYPGKEDFGIIPLEAMASGAPVIAFGEGGIKDTVTEKTGILYRPQGVDALIGAILKLEEGVIKISESDCRARAENFTRLKFQKEFLSAINDGWKKTGRSEPIESLQVL